MSNLILQRKNNCEQTLLAYLSISPQLRTPKGVPLTLSHRAYRNMQRESIKLAQFNEKKTVIVPDWQILEMQLF